MVALDPRNGDVLVLASRPAYDPNLFSRGIKHAEWRALVQDPLKPLSNRAVQGQYPPGSTFKVVVAAGGLEAGARSRRRPGSTAGAACRSATASSAAGATAVTATCDLHEAIVQSCDVFFYQAGQRLGVDSSPTTRGGSDSAHHRRRLEHEKAGTIPDSEWKQRRFHRPWFAGETLSVAIGQGYVTATPLQMANLAATIANGGTRYRPQYVKRIIAPDGTVRQESSPTCSASRGSSAVPCPRFAPACGTSS